MPAVPAEVQGEGAQPQPLLLPAARDRGACVRSQSHSQTTLVCASFILALHVYE